MIHVGLNSKKAGDLQLVLACRIGRIMIGLVCLFVYLIKLYFWPTLCSIRFCDGQL
jgi:hypothetical protein